ncbi:MAG: hypothetical protein H6908_05335 [Hyphomicrobiales bacterium]|nr:hypothetical protein [Hyphomicrobiales bacterium]
MVGPPIEQRYLDWRDKCLSFGYQLNDPQIEHCIELQEKEYRNKMIPWY